MIKYLIYPFTDNIFMLNALMAGVLVSIACGIVGTLVIFRGLTFMGDALSHGVLPGIAIAMLFDIPGIIGAAIGSLGMVFGISFITRKSNLSIDTAIGLLFVGMLACGVAIISQSHNFSGDLTRILFGEILGIGTNEILTQLISTLSIIIIVTICYRPFLLICFNPEQAEMSGFSYKQYHMIMLIIIALTVIISFQTVGTLLVFGMLIAPAASAALFAKKVTTVFFCASCIGASSTYIGLVVSYYLNIATGASIIIVASAIFFIAFITKQFISNYTKCKF